MALLNYRSPTELNDRFERSWQSGLSPLGGGGRFAVESYLGFHGNKFTRRFDANSYIVLADAMNSHDIGRDRGGVAAALARVDRAGRGDRHRLRPAVPGRGPGAHRPAPAGNIDGDLPVVLESPFGHDALPHRGRAGLRAAAAALLVLKFRDPRGTPLPGAPSDSMSRG